MTNHSESADPSTETVVTLRTPAELADALPYLLGFQPEDSVVLIALHGPRGRFGGRVRLGIPERREDWPSVAEQLAQCLVSGCERRESRPDGVVAFLCREPGGSAGDISGPIGDTFGPTGRTSMPTGDASAPTGDAPWPIGDGSSAGDGSWSAGRQVMEHLRPLAQSLRTACGGLDVPVLEVVCVSDGRFWTYCCPDQRCCPAEGTPLLPRGTSVLAAATAYAGHQMGPDQGALRARLAPWRSAAAAAAQESALHAAAVALVPRILDEGGHDEIAEETLGLARRLMDRLAEARPKPDILEADLQDDQLLAHDEAAALILGLQDRTTRDRAAEWMEGPVAAPALRLWRALARRCVGPFHEHAAAPLTLAGWVAWSLGDVVEGQEALNMALRADPLYTFALLLHPTCGADGDPEPIRRILRGERTQRESALADDLMCAPTVPDGVGLPVGIDGLEDVTARGDAEAAHAQSAGAQSAHAQSVHAQATNGSSPGSDTPEIAEDAGRMASPVPVSGVSTAPVSAVSPTSPTTSTTGSGLGFTTGSGAVAEVEPATDESLDSASRERRRGPRSAARASRPAGGAGAGPRNRRPAVRRDTRRDR
ncbi:DUF4192 domain-containing protein [Streptomyces aureocirculatus]|uniref:DUF4192 domain-containing protein n=1 Tax=Streptomyces aureocirculatus TaxID=67275 RepID=UPI000560D140|nr:DUF4192 domain-containing protein [Streptomyces aureocirculatus]